ncbi:MAG: SH3 domain-containing protein [Sphingomonadaceae bacterium]|nr:SH3 domain-containing protein [Sphingomonadaceae bacterium]
MLRLSLALLLISTMPAVAAECRPGEAPPPAPVPRFASLKKGEVNMRTGPGEQYPVSWTYKRRGLPVEIIKEYCIWRQVRDPDGETGWVNKNLLTGERTAYVTRSVRALRERADVNAKVVWRVEPGVTGRLLFCARAWCRMSVDGKSGYILRQEIWGVYPTEVVG